MSDLPNNTPAEEQLCGRVSELIELARWKVIVSVNTTMVTTYFEIGRLIVEHELKAVLNESINNEDRT